MSVLACQWTSLRPLFFGSLVISSFLVLFFIYYKPDIKFPTFDCNTERDRPPCPVTLCEQSMQSQNSNPNCSIELHVNPNRSYTQNVPAAAEDTEPDTIVLIWMWPFGSKFDLSCSMFNIRGCHLTDDRTLYNKAHGVLFHHRDIHSDLSGMPTEPRPYFQKWVWSNMESPTNSAPNPKLNHLFNLTCNYRHDSSIPAPYGHLEPLTPEDERFKLPAKDKLVCWIVSNWNPRYKRVQYYNELKKHVMIHAYGRAFGQLLSNQDYSTIVSSCKFYLSFENSVHKDYITEKLFKPMMLGSVPIVLGPSRENYEDHIPGDSFIHINDFSSAKKLAERLLHLDRSDSDYMRYFNWKNWLQVKMAPFGIEHACRTCSYLQRHRGYQAFHDLNKWYWG